MYTTQEQAAITKAQIQSALDDLNVAIPARVVGVTGPNEVSVVCEINRGRMLPDGTRTYDETTEIDDVRVMTLSCAGFSISIPVKAGCRGLLVFLDYDGDNWENGNPIPHTARTHDLNDPIFIPAFNGGRIDGDNLEIKSPTTTLILGNGFDVKHNNESLMDKLNACCNGLPFSSWKPQ